MASLDSLPGDQRAVLQLVLSRGRSYDEIGGLLSIDPSAVRERAQLALDALGPDTHITPEAQARVADYLLGQLPDSETREVRDLLAGSPDARAWARVVSSELAPLAGERPMPEIPAERSPARDHAEPIAGLGPAQPESEPAESKRRRGRRRRQRTEADGRARRRAAQLTSRRRPGHPPRGRGGGGGPVLRAARRSLQQPRRGEQQHRDQQRRGQRHHAHHGVVDHVVTATSAKVVAQINLTPPSSDKKSKAAGIAEVLNEGSTDGVAIVAQNVPPNSTKPPDAYAVWLYNSPKDAKILGFVNPGRRQDGPALDGRRPARPTLRTTSS